MTEHKFRDCKCGALGDDKITHNNGCDGQPCANIPEQPEVSRDRKAAFHKVVEPVMKWLSDNHSPHTMIIIESTSAELFGGMQAHVTDKFIKD